VSNRTFRLALYAPWFIAFVGCGISGEAPRSAPVLEDAGAETATGQQVVIPVAASANLTVVNRGAGAPFADDPLDEPVIPSGRFADYLVLLNDAFVAGLLLGTPATDGFDSSMTYLERLCIEVGTPEFRCRQRYGN